MADICTIQIRPSCCRSVSPVLCESNTCLQLPHKVKLSCILETSAYYQTNRLLIDLLDQPIDLLKTLYCWIAWKTTMEDDVESTAHTEKTNHRTQKQTIYLVIDRRLNVLKHTGVVKVLLHI